MCRSFKVRLRPEARAIDKDISHLSEFCQTRKEQTERLAQSLRDTINNAKYDDMRSPQSHVSTKVIDTYVHVLLGMSLVRDTGVNMSRGHYPRRHWEPKMALLMS